MNEPQGWAPGAPSPARPSSLSSPTPPAGAGSGGPASAPTPVRIQASSPPAPRFDSISLDAELDSPSRFVAPELTAGGAPPTPWRRIAALFACSIVVGVITGAAYVMWLRPLPVDEAVTVVEGSATTRPAHATPRAVVSDYFAALMAGNIDEALSLGPRGGTGSGALLTDEAYAETRRISPISDVHVHAADPGADEVEVSYRLGTTLVDTAVPVTPSSDGGFRLTRTTVSVSFALAHDATLPLLVNGQPVGQGQHVEVVPGSYVPTTGEPLVGYAPGSSLEVRALATPDAPQQQLQPELTAEGRAAFLAAAKDSLQECLARQDLTPAGCPMARATSRSVTPGTVVWELGGDPLSKARPVLTDTDPTTARLAVDLPLTLSVDYADGTRTRNQRVDAHAVASAVMLGEAADVAVVWSR